MQRTNLEAAECPIARALDVIGDWWSLLIVRDALLGRRRFSEFHKSLGLSKNILATRLKMLVRDGILDQVPADFGTHNDYVLTAKGRSLSLVLIALRQWGMQNCFEGEICSIELVDRATGRAIPPLQVRAEDGRLLADGETELRPREAVASPRLESDQQPAFRTRSRIKVMN